MRILQKEKRLIVNYQFFLLNQNESKIYRIPILNPYITFIKVLLTLTATVFADI